LVLIFYRKTEAGGVYQDLPLPPLTKEHCTIAEVERCLSVADEMEKTIEQSLKQAKHLHQSILKRAFKEKLVPQDLEDEPAEVLLERIKAEKAKIAKPGRKVNKLFNTIV